MGEVDPAHVQRFRRLVAEHLGLSFDEFHFDVLRRALARLASTSGSIEAYLDRLDAGVSDDEQRALAAELTVTETYFFRNSEQYAALSERVLPERAAARGNERRLQVLSAGCASGEEPYSLAIALRQYELATGYVPCIRAIDINGAMLRKAARARYSAWALRETPAPVRDTWFRLDDGQYVLHEAIRAMPKFEQVNLTRDHAHVWSPETYDVVFCRNVLMYFTPEALHAALARITRALVPGGYLFLGHAETLRGLSQDYHLCHSHGTFYYQKKDRDEALEARRSRPGSALAPTESSWAEAWVDSVQSATARIAALTSGSVLAVDSPPSARVESVRDRALALELLKQERFAEALALVGELNDDPTPDGDELLLRAVLLTHGGRLAEAEAVCNALLRTDELNTGAHYLLALCRAGSGDRRTAIEHDRMALYLDASFAMARLHLGLMARREGDRQTAQRELGQALILLQREEGSRLLLFGGGFGRDALAALCRAELVAAGGRP